MIRALTLAVLLLAGAAAPGCRSVPVEPAAPAGPRCVDGSFHGRFDPGDDESPTRRLRVNARSCPDGAVLLEVRGSVGGAVLVAAVDRGRVLLLLPRERRAVSGPSASRALWETETGLPFDGQLVRELFASSSGEPVSESRLGAWTVRLERAAGEPFPERLAAWHEAGMRLDLARRSLRPAPGAVVPPEVPDDFEQIEYDR